MGRGDLLSGTVALDLCRACTHTPVQIIAAENDYRCLISQSKEFYTWLKKRSDVPVELVRLPNASHQVYASPRQCVSYLTLVFEWIERWIPIGPKA